MMKSNTWFSRLGTFLLLLGLAATAWALEPAQGKVLLTLSGQIDVKNRGEQAVFDLAMLEALPQHTFTTKTPWDNAPVTFTGPLLRDVLAAVKAHGTQIRAVALNDYRITIPMDDSRKFNMVLAHRLNGEAIPIRTKGPLFIVYPFDSAKELQSKTYYERSIWQLKAIEID